MNFKLELSPSKPLLRSTQSLIFGYISIENKWRQIPTLPLCSVGPALGVGMSCNNAMFCP